MTRFRVIPVIDLRGGQVVRARAGQRDAYAPIDTPLASGSAPADIARALLTACASEILYVADLDAIVDGRAPDHASLAAIRRACPGTTLWVDAGFSDADRVARFLERGPARPVLGSESQRDGTLLRALGDRAVLSLDSRDGRPLGPGALHATHADWPRDVIVMCLNRVGVDAGPDLEALAAVRARRPDARIYGAGGVRDDGDVVRLARAGAAGALVASAIHAGRLNARP